MEYFHIPVLKREVLDGLKIKPDGIYLDCTLGGGGHAEGILRLLNGGRLIANDYDGAAIEHAKEIFGEYADKITYVRGDYKDILKKSNIPGMDRLDGVLIDMGVSSYQIDTPERGFSYIHDAPLDMRMDDEGDLTAEKVVNEYPPAKLTEILYEYGEEKFARRIVDKILRQRAVSPIKSTKELADIIASAYPPGERYKRGNPAKKSFQAIRIEVNRELEGLGEFIYALALRMKIGGRMCVITFHSLEDRIIKKAFVELEKECVCDKRLPVCVCGKRREAIIVTKKPISGKTETWNKRAQSAKLRIIERV